MAKVDEKFSQFVDVLYSGSEYRVDVHLAKGSFPAVPDGPISQEVRAELVVMLVVARNAIDAEIIRHREALANSNSISKATSNERTLDGRYNRVHHQ